MKLSEEEFLEQLLKHLEPAANGQAQGSQGWR
jgi:hypothetical protein